MGLSTHVLDTMHGTPAGGMAVELYAMEGRREKLVKSFVLNGDGRNPEGPLFDNASLKRGTSRRVSGGAPSSPPRGVQRPAPPFLDRVTLDFGIADASSHYHVPLLVSP